MAVRSIALRMVAVDVPVGAASADCRRRQSDLGDPTEPILKAFQWRRVPRRHPQKGDWAIWTDLVYMNLSGQPDPREGDRPAGRHPYAAP